MSRGSTDPSSDAAAPRSVLVVENERLDDPHAAWLRAEDDYEVRTAATVDAVRDRIRAVDAVLLEIPAPTVDHDLVRAVTEHGDGVRAAVVAGTTPTFDPLALGIDEYVVDPVRPDALRRTVDSLLLRATYDAQLAELYELATERSAMAVGGSDAPPGEPSHEELLERIDVLRDRIVETSRELSQGDFELEFRRLAADGAV